LQLLASDELALALGQQCQHAQGLFLQPDPGTVPANLPRGQIHKVRAKLERW